jgi:hypothetical protein
MLRRAAEDLVKSDRGSTAVEVAPVLPIRILVVGTLSACLLVFSNASLHFATEHGARCYSVNSSQCGSVSAAQTYAKSLYAGMGTPTFTATTPSCGHQITGSVTISFNATQSLDSALERHGLLSVKSASRPW